LLELYEGERALGIAFLACGRDDDAAVRRGRVALLGCKSGRDRLGAGVAGGRRVVVEAVHARTSGGRRIGLVVMLMAGWDGFVWS
jgi:hypothetical protein